ncbi:cysteine proteinase [Roridomyces roridus]|uniref:Cysteine proteinase n=1 Tax=Roridomyces roridus TaxID=1738132 RepID=A0AAD7BDT4_9AGAR|nr:cysteine proteinase [Roridomyces roridus]
MPQPKYNPSDVCRVTQIFAEPRFFVDGADSNDIIQGALNDCWFLSAVATTSTTEGLVDKCCVARDEEVGIYGFVFFKNGRWVHIIIDDLLYTDIPKYEELNSGAKTLYHHDKEHYNSWARRGGQTLYFAKSGTDGETWVALLEKAYAKLHGDYASLEAGYAGEGVEDLTGGVSTYIQTKDILNINKFWEEELLNANKDRLFGCSFTGAFDGSGDPAVRRGDGLIAHHAYSVLRAKEVNGKKFVVVRNPWGRCEWTGRWADGSKEWTPGWLEILPQLGHVFGDDGEFIMEYADFLDSWDQIDRTRLLDSSWITSSQWLSVVSRQLPSAWTYGDVCFTISLPKPSFTIIVLSQLDMRSYEAVAGDRDWSFDFILFKRGDKSPVATSLPAEVDSRSVNVEIQLDAGEYVVHVRLDCSHRSNKKARKDARLRTAKARSEYLASNFRADGLAAASLSLPIQAIAGLDFRDMEKKAIEIVEARKKEKEQEKKEKGEEAKKKKEEEDEEEKDKAKDNTDDHSPVETITTTTVVEATVTTVTTIVEAVDNAATAEDPDAEQETPSTSVNLGEAVPSPESTGKTNADSAAAPTDSTTSGDETPASSTNPADTPVDPPKSSSSSSSSSASPLSESDTESKTKVSTPKKKKRRPRVPKLVTVPPPAPWAPRSPGSPPGGGGWGTAPNWGTAASPRPGALQMPSLNNVDDIVHLGIRVHTEEACGAATIEGQLRYELEMEFAKSKRK